MFAVHVEGVDDITFASTDVGGAALAGAAEDGAFAVEFVPAAEGGFDDDEVLVGEPELWLGGDDGAVLKLRGFVLMEAELGIADAFFGIDVSGMGFQVIGEEIFCLLIVLVREGFVRGEEFRRNGPLGCAGCDERGEEDGYDGCVVAWVEFHVLPAPSLPHGLSAHEGSEDCDRCQQGDPEEVWVALVVRAGNVTLDVAGVELLRS